MKLFRHCGKRYAGLGAAFASDGQGGITYVQAAFVFQQLCRNFAQVSGENRIPELHAVQGTVHHEAVAEFLQHEVEAACPRGNRA